MSVTVNKMLKNDPMITYNHMQEDGQKQNQLKAPFNFRIKNKLMLIFIAEEILIALLLALIFYMI